MPRKVALGFVVAAFVLLVVVTLAIRVAAPLSRPHIERWLSDYFNGEVEVAAFDAGTFPRTWVELRRVVVRHEGRRDIPPIVTADRVVIESGLLGLLRRPLHVQTVRFEGLHICVPSLHKSAHPTPRTGAERSSSSPPVKYETGDTKRHTPVVVRTVQCDGTILDVGGDAGKDKTPTRFTLYTLRIHDAALDRPLQFDATFSARANTPSLP